MKKFTISFILTVIIFAGLVWASETRTTGEIVKIKEIYLGSILVKSSSGREIQIEIPKIISKLINREEEYFVSYSKKKWSNWRLKQIEPIKAE